MAKSNATVTNRPAASVAPRNTTNIKTTAPSRRPCRRRRTTPPTDGMPAARTQKKRVTKNRTLNSTVAAKTMRTKNRKRTAKLNTKRAAKKPGIGLLWCWPCAKHYTSDNVKQCLIASRCLHVLCFLFLVCSPCVRLRRSLCFCVSFSHLDYLCSSLRLCQPHPICCEILDYYCAVLWRSNWSVFNELALLWYVTLWVFLMRNKKLTTYLLVHTAATTKAGEKRKTRRKTCKCVCVHRKKPATTTTRRRVSKWTSLSNFCVNNNQ